jgi:hypothetical protein
MKKLTMEEWIDIGNRLSQLHEDMVNMTVMVSKCGSVRYSNKLSRFINPLLRLRSDLEERMFEQYPNAKTTVFFGGVNRKEHNTKSHTRRHITL